jgi:hypothetical protein
LTIISLSEQNPPRQPQSFQGFNKVMKKLLLILTIALATLGAFAQGKIGFNTDSLHLVYWAYNGQAVNSDNMPPGIPGLEVDLYMGTSSSLLYLYSSTTFGPLASGPGKWTSMSVTANANATTGAPGIPTGTSAFVEIAVHTTEKAPSNIFDPVALQTFEVSGSSSLFNFTLGGPITYPPVWGSNGNWPIGTFPMDQYGVGSRGAIALGIPEPSAIALLGFGAAMFIFRRRK